jgi:hypothetical protein
MRKLLVTGLLVMAALAVGCSSASKPANQKGR